MLKSLNISNYAIIRDLKIDFDKGLSTVTGETGAGKSILLGALSLILGQRADTSVLMNKQQKCIVEGLFSFPDGKMHSFFVENDLDIDDEILIRREINSSGKSRAFVNDTPVNLQVLKTIGELLVDIHSQHESLHLNHYLYQLNVLDAFAGLEKEAEQYYLSWKKFRDHRHEYEQMKARLSEQKKEIDFLRFQFNELEEAKISKGETAELESEIEILTHAEEIKSGLFNAWQNLSGAEELNALALLKKAENQLQRLKEFHNASGELFKRLESAVIELKDIATEAELLAEKVDHDPGRLITVEDRLNLIYSLQQKHSLQDADDLPGMKDELEQKINEIDSSDEKLVELEKELEKQGADLMKKAEGLSLERQKAIPELEAGIEKLLFQLGIPNAQFKIQNQQLSNPGEHGIDQIRFLFTANKKSEVQEISKIASGGEISRLMLSIKSIISDSLGLPTIIFDEIDTGVSGEIAHKVAIIMKEMAIHRQVITITHLPQVASRGDSHYLVYKTDDEESSSTSIRKLHHDDRLIEIAKMLSGEQTTEAALANARELMGNR